MKWKRDYYLDRLINMDGNSMIKIITGIRRCGKSYLLDPIFKNYLIKKGIEKDHIIKIDFDSRKNKKYLNPDILEEYIDSKIIDKKKYYLLLDEVQKVNDFESVLNEFLRIQNVEIYVTGSNSKFLSTDIVTEFRGRGIEIKVFPLSFKEFLTAYDGNKTEAWNDFAIYGGLPAILLQKSDIEKRNYLEVLLDTVYIKDVIERNNISDNDTMEKLIEIVSSNIGSLTNPKNLSDAYYLSLNEVIDHKTVSKYLKCLKEAFIIEKVERYDIKGKQYFDTPYKYYFSDIGIRNVLLNFRQIEYDHIMENIIYNELVKRGYNVDVGIVEKKTTVDGKTVRNSYEVDFVCNLGSKKYYIQSAYAMTTDKKVEQEKKSLLNIHDSFKKIIIVKDDTKVIRDENGIVTMNLFDFLLNEDSLDF